MTRCPFLLGRRRWAFGGSGMPGRWADRSDGRIDAVLPETDIGTFAQVSLDDAGGTALDGLVEPTFTTDNYCARAPRFVIDLDNGDSLWGYPSNAGLNGTDFAWAINNGISYLPWSVVQATETGTTITDAVVIADGGQASGTTYNISDLTFNGTDYNSETCP